MRGSQDLSLSLLRQCSCFCCGVLIEGGNVMKKYRRAQRKCVWEAARSRAVGRRGSLGPGSQVRSECRFGRQCRHTVYKSPSSDNRLERRAPRRLL